MTTLEDRLVENDVDVLGHPAFDESPTPKASPEFPPTSGARRITPIKSSLCPRNAEAPGM